MFKQGIVEKFKINDKKVVFRYPIAKENIADLLALINSLIEERAMISLQKKVTPNEEKAWLINNLKEIKKKEKVLFLVEVDGKIMGNAEVKTGKDATKHVGNLGILLRKEIRGQGIGKKLLKTIIREAEKALKVKIITLSVFSTNKVAKGVYRKVGFKEVGKIKKGINHYGKFLDDVVMAKYL